MSESGPHFSGMFFTSLCSYMGCKKLETTAHHPQSNGQTGRDDKTIAVRLNHYVARNNLIPILTYRR